LAVSTGTAWGTSVLPGTAGNVLTSNGTSWVSQAGAAAASVQTFASSGTWTKPAGAQFVLVEVWGAGGGGGRPTAGAANGPGSGGGGGSYKQEIFLASSLPSSVSVIIAAGGTGGTSNGASGTSGGNTNFGGLIAAWGGSGGNGFATGTNVNSGGTGGGTQSAGTNNSRIAGAPQNYNGAVGNYDIGPSNFGGGIGGGTYTLGTTTTTIYNGRSSGFGGGGGGAANGSASTGDIGNGGASSYGGGGGGAGGASTTSGSSFARSAAEGGGPIPFTIDAVGSGVGGGARTTPGAKAPTPAAFLGGAGGSAAFSQASFSNAIGDVNGSQVVLLSQSSLGASENLLVINVSSNGLSNYTPYAVVNRAVNISRAGIAFDGSKYVICCLQFITAVPNSFYRYIISTTDFVNFTEHPVPSNLDGAVTGDTNTQAGSNYLKYINSTFFMCTSTDVFYSTNLVTWTRANIAGGSNAQVRDFAYDGTFYYALVGGGVRRSSDLSTWTQYAHGAGASSESLAASPTHVVVTSSFGTARFSTDQGVTWSNLPSVPANVGRTVRYFAATASWLMSWNDIGAGTRGGYFSTAPGTSWTLVTTSSAVTHNQPIYNGSRYIFAASSVAMVSTAIGGTYTAQTSTTLSLAAAAGGDGGVAGGGGGGAASSTTTTNGGAGGNGLCRVYTW
jgi:hypothetical protein